MVHLDFTPWDDAAGFARVEPTHAVVTDDHRKLAASALWPLTPPRQLTDDMLAGMQRRQLARVAQAIADAEARDASVRTRADAMDAAYQRGLERGFKEAVWAITARADGWGLKS